MDSAVEDPPPKEPLRKATSACTLCQLRKRRCEGVQPCSYCQAKGVADECTFVTPNKRGPKKGAVYKKRRPRVVNPPPPVEEGAPTATAEDPVPLPLPSFVAPRPAPSTSTSTLPLPTPIPASAPASALPQPPPSPLAEISAPLLSHLLQIHHQYLNALTDLPLFSTSPSLTSPPALLYALAGSAAPFSTHPLVAASTTENGRDWVMKAREELLRNEEIRFSEEGVQTMIVLAGDALVRGEGRQAGLDVAGGISVALSLGFDRPQLTAQEQEEGSTKHRALFTLYALSLHLSLGSSSLLPLTHAASAVLPLPLPSSPATPILTLQSTELSSHPSLTLEPYLLRSLHLLHQVIELSSSPSANRTNDWDPSSTFSLLSLQLSDWGDLPLSANFNSTVLASLALSDSDDGEDGETGNELETYLTMHLAHHLAYLLLFRPYLPLPRGVGVGGEETRRTKWAKMKPSLGSRVMPRL
ncbi:hypothetical protein BCR35DRAFT_87918 [Leucosporidium creatinivorum]|uniref:Zn(2)-C6 fungal-type domain-containing protein n=1 Tax=Leucosporidium creatinivorum TaxID=106004 RepID=A0A1Y2FBN2_9BASI|nr:hypothetical protein BCR35DRAFT_87918 [Leucosporidium creatinivorum]